MERVLFAAAEGLPFIKSGGLADVIGSLPKGLSDQGAEVAVVLPLYRKIMAKFPDLDYITEFDVQSGVLYNRVEVYGRKIGSVQYYFIREDDYYDRDEMYGYGDDAARFGFYCQAVLDMLSYIDFKPTVIHSHDWHTGMIALLCKTCFDDPYYQSIKHVYTIHNLAFQGNFGTDALQYLNVDSYFLDNGDIAFDTGISFLKAAVMFSDRITTVSQTYAEEIMTPEFGERMQEVLKQRSDVLSGIVNGIDTDSWNPATDKFIAQNYSVDNLDAKLANKRELQRELGLRVADDVLLIGIVSRLTWQKGVNIILEKLGDIMNQDVQFVILGTGEANVENEFKKIEYIYPHRAVFYCGYNEELSHRMYAGVDVLLMPSLFEPCGISQLISMRYGVLPLVRETGGLKDTVEPYNQYTKTGTGFSFRSYNGDEMFYVLAYLIHTYYYQKEDWRMLQENAMRLPVDWASSAAKYLDLYQSI